MILIKRIGILIGICLVFYGGCFSNKMLTRDQSIQKITIDSFRELKNSGNDFVLYIGRPSCRYCAIVSSYVYTMKNPPLPVYYISLEPFLGHEEYETIKRELDTVYLPCFKYISDREIQYNLNNPLDSSYYDLDGPERMKLYRQMQDKINAFLDGAAGQAPPINESPASEEIVTAIPVKENTYD